MIILTDGSQKLAGRTLTVGAGLTLTEDATGLPILQAAGATSVTASTKPYRLVPFAVEGLSGPVELSIPPGTAETTPLVRVWVSFQGCTIARLQGHIAVAGATGQQLAAKWWDASNSAWQFLGLDANGVPGPVLDVDVSGDLLGDDITLDPAVAYATDVLVGLFGVAP